MSRPARSSLRPRILVALALSCLAFSVAGPRLQGEKPVADQQAESSSPIVFDGWRRTAHGWERFPFADARPSINDWIVNQKKEEADNPLTRPLQQLGQVHPIRIASAEVGLACLIAFVASDGRIWTAETTQQTSGDAVK